MDCFIIKYETKKTFETRKTLAVQQREQLVLHEEDLELFPISVACQIHHSEWKTNSVSIVLI